MYDAHRARGLLIVGVPCNQFASEEPWPEPQIKEWLAANYSVDFPMLAKCDVIGDGKHQLYQFFDQALPQSKVEWNFAKYLVDRNGNVVKFFHHSDAPESLMPDIE